MKVHQLKAVKDSVLVETEKLEQVESDHLRLMQGISECIREIESQRSEVGPMHPVLSRHTANHRVALESLIFRKFRMLQYEGQL